MEYIGWFLEHKRQMKNDTLMDLLDRWLTVCMTREWSLYILSEPLFITRFSPDKFLWRGSTKTFRNSKLTMHRWVLPHDLEVLIPVQLSWLKSYEIVLVLESPIFCHNWRQLKTRTEILEEMYPWWILSMKQFNVEFTMIDD